MIKVLFKYKTLLLFVSLILLDAPNALGQNLSSKTTRVLIVLDASFSMKTIWKEDERWETAKDVIEEVLDSLENIPNLEFALRVYGHQMDQKEKNCRDSRLEVSFSRNSEDRIIRKLSSINPVGITPIAYSIEQAARDFTMHPNARNVVILVTDGLESCDGDPCAISTELQKKQVFLKPFVIGMGVNPALFGQLECIGEAKNASNEAHFRDLFWEVVNKTISGCSAEVDLLDVEGQPIETDLNMTFYDHANGNLIHSFYHTMNSRGKPDTMYLESLYTYDIEVHTIPPVRLDSVKLSAGIHNIIPIYTPQGELTVKLMESTLKYTFRDKIRYILRKAGTKKIVNVEHLDQTTKYLVGTYDLEILTLPRTVIKNIEISQDQKTTLEIPSPGMLNVSSVYPGVGGIFEIKNGRLNKIFNFENNKALRQVIAMQPGAYKALFRTNKSTESESTVEKTFTIESQKTITIKLN